MNPDNVVSEPALLTTHCLLLSLLLHFPLLPQVASVSFFFVCFLFIGLSAHFFAEYLKLENMFNSSLSFQDLARFRHTQENTGTALEGWGQGYKLVPDKNPLGLRV